MLLLSVRKRLFSGGLVFRERIRLWQNEAELKPLRRRNQAKGAQSRPCGTGYFQAPARQLTSQANLKAILDNPDGPGEFR